MHRILVVILFLLAVSAIPAQKAGPGQSQHTINVPNPTQGVSPMRRGNATRYGHVWNGCADRDAALLEIIRQLTDDNSVDNEIKYETDHGLGESDIFDRRKTLISTLIQSLRSPKAATK